MPATSVCADREVFDGGEGRGLGGRNGTIHFILRVSPEALHVVHRADSLGDQPRARVLDRATGDPLIDLGLCPVSLVVVPHRADVLPPPVGHTLHEGRPVTLPRLVHGLLGGGKHREHVVPVHTHRGHAVGGGS